MPQNRPVRRTRKLVDTAEARRLRQADRGMQWRRWGPYVSERQWGTVREDYSEGGNAWDYFPHDQARSRAYRWGEDGIAGFCDRHQWMCLGLGLWNGRDPILKERLFGLTNSEGNHGEDCKEIYYYIDCTPTHSYQRMLYRYPIEAYPYARICEENRRRGQRDLEFEVEDTGVFDDFRYFDVEVEYAKVGVDDIQMLVTVYNRSAEAAELHVLPHLWFRNIWSWQPDTVKPVLRGEKRGRIAIEHAQLPPMKLLCDGGPELLFCDNDTNGHRLFGMKTDGYFKDGINDFVVNGDRSAVNPAATGTKAAAHYRLTVPAHGEAHVRVRLMLDETAGGFADFDNVMKKRRAEADEFYNLLLQETADAERQKVQRQALAGMLWSKQFYHIDTRRWLEGDPTQPAPPAGRKHGRNHDWAHLYNEQIMSMPDKWEYPWYAAWDLAFHCVTFALVDPSFAKEQLLLLLREWYMNPNGQLPAYEFAFGDVNPPVHAWAAWRVYKISAQRGQRDLDFLERAFQKLLLNFTWWVNRKDANGKNLFTGGFLGLDNISVFDRSGPAPGGGELEQADATAWMAFYCGVMLAMAFELAQTRPPYEDIASKFFEHFVAIIDAINSVGGGLWDDEDGFYYDQLRWPAGQKSLKTRSIVGVIPLFAVQVFREADIDKLPGFRKRLAWFLENKPKLAQHISNRKCADAHYQDIALLAIPTFDHLKRVLRYVLDENEFLSDYGVRALSRYHRDHPYEFRADGQKLAVQYVPGESNSGLFGGNSNWRGPIWFPVNYLLVEALERYHLFCGDDLKVECPTGSGRMLNLLEVSHELVRRLSSIFLKDASGKRVVHGQADVYSKNPTWQNLVLFYEYFHGDSGQGVGASHQTGWTALVTRLLEKHAQGRNPRSGFLASDV